MLEQYQISLKAKRQLSGAGSLAVPLVDPALIDASYRVGGAKGPLLDGGPAVGHPHSPAYSEDSHSL